MNIEEIELKLAEAELRAAEWSARADGLAAHRAALAAAEANIEAAVRKVRAAAWKAPAGTEEVRQHLHVSAHAFTLASDEKAARDAAVLWRGRAVAIAATRVEHYSGILAAAEALAERAH